jgi:hypothetical protein
LTVLLVENSDVVSDPVYVSTAWSTAALAIHTRQLDTSVHVPMAFVHPALSNPGQAPMFQPIAPSERSSPSPQSRLAPPHATLIVAKSFVCATASALAVRGSPVHGSDARRRPLALLS